MASFGGGKKQSIPAVKSIGDLQGEAVNANIASLPSIIEAMKKYGPEYAASMLKANYAANPTLKPLADLIGGRLEQAKGGGIPDYLRSHFTDNVRSAQTARGFADSPISAVTEATQLGGLAETANQFSIGAGLDLANNPNMGVSAEGMGLQLPSLDRMTGLAQEQNVSDMNRFIQQEAIDASNKKKKAALIGAGLGAVAGSFGGPAGTLAGAKAGAEIGTFF